MTQLSLPPGASCLVVDHKQQWPIEVQCPTAPGVADNPCISVVEVALSLQIVQGERNHQDSCNTVCLGHCAALICCQEIQIRSSRVLIRLIDVDIDSESWRLPCVQAMCRDYYALEFIDPSIDTSPIAPALGAFFDDVLDTSVTNLNFKVGLTATPFHHGPAWLLCLAQKPKQRPIKCAQQLASSKIMACMPITSCFIVTIVATSSLWFCCSVFPGAG